MKSLRFSRPRRSFKKFANYAAVAIAACGAAKAAGPNLVYSNSDIPALRKKVEGEKYREIWKAYLAQADRFADPSSKEYMNPDRPDQDLDQHEYDVRGHYSGKRLTQAEQYLGLAYHLTGDEKYRDLGVRLLVAYAKTIPVTHPYHVKGYAGGKGDFMRGLAMGYDQFGEYLSAEDKKIVLEAMKGYVDDYLADAENPSTAWVPYHNYMGVCGGAAGCLALELADLDPKLSKDYVARITDRVKLWLAMGFDKQGANYEGIAYSLYGLDNASLFATALQRAGGENLFQQPPFNKLINFYVMSTLPGEKNTDNRNDSGYWTIGDIMLKCAAEHKDGRGTWLFVQEDKDPLFMRLSWDKDVPPVSPEKFGTPLYEYFEGRGLSIWRTGWEKDDVMFSVECGPYHSVTHAQADKGQITLYGYGYRWVCDAGYASNRDPEGRAQTAAHNLILIDGKGAAICGGGMGSNGETLISTNNDVYGYALVDATKAYRENAVRNGDYRAPMTAEPHMKMDRALRHCIFLRPSNGVPAYAVVLDNISQDGNPHEYTWQILSWQNLDIQVTGNGTATVAPNPEARKETGPGQMFVYLTSESEPKLSNGLYETGGNPVLPRLQATCKAVNPYFAAVLIPTAGAIKPEVKFEQTGEVTTIRVQWPNRIDKIVWKKASRTQPEITVAKR